MSGWYIHRSLVGFDRDETVFDVDRVAWRHEYLDDLYITEITQIGNG